MIRRGRFANDIVVEGAGDLRSRGGFRFRQHVRLCESDLPGHDLSSPGLLGAILTLLVQCMRYSGKVDHLLHKRVLSRDDTIVPLRGTSVRPMS